MIATEAGELEAFTPPSLKNVALPPKGQPPVFKLRPTTRREWQKYQYLMRAEGLEYHDKDEFREETIRALKKLYTPAQAAEYETRLRSYWTLIDQKGAPDPAEQDAVNDLVARLTREWTPMARMAADLMRFQEESLRIAISMFLVGWTGLDLKYRMEDGRTPLELVDDVEAALRGIEKKAIEDKVEGVIQPGVAFVELANACFKQMRLGEDEEKNSFSPPSTPSGPNGSTKKPSAKRAASSKTSASSESTTA